MGIKHWPEDERPREKMLYKGPASLSDAELLAIFLRTGVKGKTAVDLARELLNGFGGLRPLLESSREQFCSAKGLGNAKYVQLQAVLEMAKRHLFEPLKRGTTITSSDISESYLMAKLRGYSYEVFACLFLDNKNRMIAFEEMFRGTINFASVHPREIVKKALEYNAAAMIVAHNHPSGDSEPSHSDELITEKLQDALALVDIRLLDHFIIGDQDCTSMADMGIL